MATTGLSYSALGAMLGISKAMVGKLAKQGMPLNSAEAASAWRAANLDVSRTKAARVDVSAPPAPPRSSPPPDLLTYPDDDAQIDAPPRQERSAEDDAYKRARTGREQTDYELRLIELERARGSVVDRALVAQLRFTEFRSLRDALGFIAPRIASACAAETDAVIVEALITEELNRVLSAFADQVMTRDILQDEADDDEDPAD